MEQVIILISILSLVISAYVYLQLKKEQKRRGVLQAFIAGIAQETHLDAIEQALLNGVFYEDLHRVTAKQFAKKYYMLFGHYVDTNDAFVLLYINIIKSLIRDYSGLSDSNKDEEVSGTDDWSDIPKSLQK